MNSFYEHHQHSIRFDYRCFDRILLNGLIQPFQQPERVIGFFTAYRQIYPVEPRHAAGHRRRLSAMAEIMVGEAKRCDFGGSEGSSRRVRRALLQERRAIDHTEVAPDFGTSRIVGRSLLRMG